MVVHQMHIVAEYSCSGTYQHTNTIIPATCIQDLLFAPSIQGINSCGDYNTKTDCIYHSQSGCMWDVGKTISITSQCSDITSAATCSTTTGCTLNQTCVSDLVASSSCLSTQNSITSCEQASTTSGCTGNYDKVVLGDKIDWNGNLFNWTEFTISSFDYPQCIDYWVDCSSGTCQWMDNEYEYDPYGFGSNAGGFDPACGRTPILSLSGIVGPAYSNSTTTSTSCATLSETDCNNQLYSSCSWSSSVTSCAGLSNSICSSTPECNLVLGCVDNNVCPSGIKEISSCIGTYTSGGDIKLDWNGGIFDWTYRNIYYSDGMLAATCLIDDIGVQQYISPANNCVIIDGVLSVSSNGRNGKLYTPYTTGNWEMFVGIIESTGYLGDSASLGAVYDSQPIVTNNNCDTLFGSACVHTTGCELVSTVNSCSNNETIDSTYCLDESIDNPANNSIKGNSTLVTAYKQSLTTTTIVAEDVCIDSNTLREYYCSGVSPNNTINSSVIICDSGYECSSGACVVNISQPGGPDINRTYWGSDFDYSFNAAQHQKVNTTSSYSVKLVYYNPDNLASATFEIYEQDNVSQIPSLNDLVATVTATKDSNGYLVASYIFTTIILPNINNGGIEGPGFDFYFVPQDSVKPVSNNLVLEISNSTQPNSCATDPGIYFENAVCNSDLGENSVDCPLDCFNIDDGVCSTAAGENHFNSPNDCPLTSTAKLKWMFGELPNQEVPVNYIVNIDKEKIDEENFIMSYIKTPLETGLSFDLEGLDKDGVWKSIKSFDALENNGDLFKNWNLKYSDFWNLGFDSSQKDYSFRFKINNIVSENLMIKLSGVIPVCNDGIKNGAERGVDCSGECSYDGLGSNTCDLLSCIPAPITCSDYTTQTSCDTNECSINSINGASCYWNVNTCESQIVSDVGVCHIAEDVATDDCTDGIYSYGYTANFTWNSWVPTKADNQFGVDYSYDTRDSKWHYDPDHVFSSCIDGSETVPCSAQVKLTFWTWQNILASVGLIFLGYYILGIKRPKKKLVKKKSSKKKLVKKYKK